MSCPLCGDVCRCDPELRSRPPSDEQGSQNGAVAEADPRLPLHNPQSAALRQEIAARVHRYRSRRTYRGPRYPSLRLKFEPGEETSSRSGAAAAVASSETALRQTISSESAVIQARPASGTEPAAQRRAPELQNAIRARETSHRDAAAKIIEFPRSNMAPVPLDELAEPVIDRPRILDVPEPASPPPAMGGILLGPVEEKEPEKRPGFELPLQSAALEQRLVASAVDACVVLVASSVFGYLCFRITNMKPSLRFAMTAMAVVSGFFWMAYQYLFIVHTGTTLGLKSAKLQLSRFDGTPPSRTLRRWRVLVSLLSALSLGMGFFWCFLDEDALCWHDRMTRTYLAPRNPV